MNTITAQTFFVFSFCIGASANAAQVSYNAHVALDGWLPAVSDGATAGLPGSGKQLEAFTANLATKPYVNSGVQYQAHVSTQGWQTVRADGATAGTTGLGLAIEAIRIQLVNVPANYRVRYRVYRQNVGWTGWSYDGADAGTTGLSSPLEAFEVVVEINNAPPSAPTVLSQYTTAGSAITAGAVTAETSIRLRGNLSDPDGDSVALQVELHPSGQPFNGSPTHQSGYVGSNGTAEILVTGLAQAEYEWRGRTVDSNGAVSSWVDAGYAGADFSVNYPEPPNLPVNLWQYKLNGTTPMAAGSTTNENGALLQGAISDPDGDNVQLQIEVRPVGGLTGTPTHYSTSMPSGSTPQIPVLNLPNGSYEWQARTYDQTGYSAWVQAGYTGADLVVAYVAPNTPPADPVNLWQYRTDGTTEITAGGTTDEATVLLSGKVSDPDGGQVQLQIEVAPLGTLTGTPNIFSTMAPSGTTVQVPFNIPADGGYEWQARTYDGTSYSPTPWVSAGYGGADFVAAIPWQLIRQAGDIKVYFVSGGVARHIPDPETFELLRFNWAAIQDITATQFAAYGTPGPDIATLRTGNYRDGSLIRQIGTNEVYLIENAIGRHVPDPDTLFAMGRRFDEVIDLPAELWRVPIGAPLPALGSPDFVDVINGLGFNPASAYLLGVNAANGNFVYRGGAFNIPGRGMPFTFNWSYNAQDSYDYDMGPGWNHAFHVEAQEVQRNGANAFLRVKWGDGHDEVFGWDGTAYQPRVNLYKTVSGGGGAATLTVVDKGRITYTFALDPGATATQASVDSTGTSTSITTHRYRLASIADRNGNTLTLNYGGVLASVTDTSGRNIAFGYTQMLDQSTNITVSRLTSVTDPAGRSVQFSYDASARLASVTDPGGGVTRFTYKPDTVMGTPNPLIATITDPRGNPAVSPVFTDINGQTPVVSDPNYRKVASVQVGGGVQHGMQYAGGQLTVTTNGFSPQVYQSDNNRLTSFDPGDGQGPPYTQTYNDSRSLLPSSIIDRAGRTTSLTFNAINGGLQSVSAPLNTNATLDYDLTTGDLIHRTDAEGRITSYTHDANGNVTAITAPIGTTNIGYNTFGQPTTVTDPSGSVTTYVYDAQGNIAEVREPLGRTTTYTYDAVGRKLSETDPNGNITNFTYDNNDHLLTVTNALNQTTRFEYDANGNRTAVVDANNHRTTYAYDARNRQTSVTDPAGAVTQYQYDDRNQLTRITDANGNATSFAYDNAGNLITVTDPANGTVRYTYDANGNRLSMEDPNHHVTTYAYDDLNRLVTETGPTPVSSVYRYGYDKVGNRTSMVDAKAQRTTYAFDVMDRLTGIGFPDSTGISYQYDLNGNRIQMVDGLGMSSYTYDALNRLTAYAGPFGHAVGYGYDPAGNRTRITYPGGNAVNYGYDALNRLATVTDWLNQTTTYSYDPASRLTGVANANGTTAAYSYDPADRLTGLLNRKADGTTISSYSYVLDPVGNHLQVNQVEPLEPVLPDLTVSYGYDAENRLTNAGGINYTHDANGNMTARGVDTFTYDYRDKLTQSVIGGVSSSYGYDGDGVRLSKTENGVTTRYVQDINGKLPNVLIETDGTGAVGAYYVYGLGLISLIQPDGTTRTYHYDSRGSTIALTDAAQGVTDSYAYGPFGAVANKTGVNGNPFTFVGRYGLRDDGNGLVQIRARYYMPKLGRFITRDLTNGNERDTQTENRFIYSVNNPIRLFDLNGLSATSVGRDLSEVAFEGIKFVNRVGFRLGAKRAIKSLKSIRGYTHNSPAKLLRNASETLGIINLSFTTIDELGGARQIYDAWRNARANVTEASLDEWLLALEHASTSTVAISLTELTEPINLGYRVFTGDNLVSFSGESVDRTIERLLGVEK